MKEITLYTDGACSGNPGKGGWGAVLIYNQYQKQYSGYNPNTTNNRMELTAVIEGLKMLKESCVVTCYTDSAYVSNAFLNDWISNWKARGWRTADKKPVLNLDLWQELLALCEKHKVSFVKVKGHADNELNNLCDKLATGEIAKHIDDWFLRLKIFWYANIFKITFFKTFAMCETFKI